MTNTTNNRAANSKVANRKAGNSKVAREKQLKLQKQAQVLKDQMSINAVAVVAYRETSGDYGDMSQQSEQEWLFLNQNRANGKELGLIEKALQRIKDGSYGSCARCAQPISPQRLRAIPWAECCLECQDNGSSGAMSVTA